VSENSETTAFDGAKYRQVLGHFPTGVAVITAMTGAGKFCVNILADDQEDVSRVFGSKADDKFSEIGWKHSGNGAPLINGVLAYIDCDLHSVLDGGDHDIIVCAVTDLDVKHEGGALVFFRGGYGRVAF